MSLRIPTQNTTRPVGNSGQEGAAGWSEPEDVALASSASAAASATPSGALTSSSVSLLTRACDNCRSSHTKCDGAERCLNCARKNLTCVYSKAKRRGRKPARIDGTFGSSDALSHDTGMRSLVVNDAHTYVVSGAGTKRQRLSAVPNVAMSASHFSADEFKHMEQPITSYLHAYQTSINFLFGSFAPVPSAIAAVDGPLRTCADLARAASQLQHSGVVEDQAALVTICAAAAIGAMIMGSKKAVVDDILQTADDMSRLGRGLIFDFSSVSVASAFLVLGYAFFTHAQAFNNVDASSSTENCDFDDDGDFDPESESVSPFKAVTYLTLSAAICQHANIFNTTVVGLTVQLMRLIADGSVAPQQRADGYAHVACSAFGICPGRTIMASVFRIQECIKHNLNFDVAEARSQLGELLASLSQFEQDPDSVALTHFLKLIINSTLGWLQFKKGDSEATERSEFNHVERACDQMRALGELPRAYPPCWTTQFVRLKALVTKTQPSSAADVDVFVQKLPWKSRVAHVYGSASPAEPAPATPQRFVKSDPNAAASSNPTPTIQTTQPHMMHPMPNLTPQQLMFLPQIMGLSTAANMNPFMQPIRPGMVPMPNGMGPLWPGQPLMPGIYPTFGPGHPYPL